MGCLNISETADLLAWLTPDPILIETWVWETHVHFLVFEAWFRNARR